MKHRSVPGLSGDKIRTFCRKNRQRDCSSAVPMDAVPLYRNCSMPPPAAIAEADRGDLRRSPLTYRKMGRKSKYPKPPYNSPILFDIGPLPYVQLSNL